MSVIPRPVTGRLKVADCSGFEDDLTFPEVRPHRAGGVGFGGEGFNSCVQIIPIQPTTWSGIKATIRE
jgi:hypothetical protein